MKRVSKKDKAIIWRLQGEKLCCVCCEPMTLDVKQSEYLAKRGSLKFTWWPGVILTDGRVGHLECFVGKGDVPNPSFESVPSEDKNYCYVSSTK